MTLGPATYNWFHPKPATLEILLNNQITFKRMSLTRPNRSFECIHEQLFWETTFWLRHTPGHVLKLNIGSYCSERITNWTFSPDKISWGRPRILILAWFACRLLRGALRYLFKWRRSCGGTRRTTGRRNYLTNGMEGNLNLKILMSSRRRELLGAQDLLSLTIGPKES